MTAAMLAPLRDIEGVEGAFVVNTTGMIVARDLPALFDDEVVQDAGLRIATLFEAVSENFELVDEIDLTYDGFTFSMRRAGAAFLVVVATPRALLQPVKMVSNLVARKLRAAGGVAPPATSVLVPLASSPTASTPASRTRPSPGDAMPGAGAVPRVSPSKRVVNGAPASAPASASPAPAPKKKNDIWED